MLPTSGWWATCWAASGARSAGLATSVSTLPARSSACVQISTSARWDWIELPCLEVKTYCQKLSNIHPPPWSGSVINGCKTAQLKKLSPSLCAGFSFLLGQPSPLWPSHHLPKLLGLLRLPLQPRLHFLPGRGERVLSVPYVHHGPYVHKIQHVHQVHQVHDNTYSVNVKRYVTFKSGKALQQLFRVHWPRSSWLSVGIILYLQNSYIA